MRITFKYSDMKPQDFLSIAKNNSQVTWLKEYESRAECWDYYSNPTGYLNGNYFCIYFSSIAGRERIEVSNLTKNKSEFMEFFGIIENF